MKKPATYLVAVISLFLFLQACSKQPVPPEQVTLKVWAWEGDFNGFANDFMAKHPNIRLVRVQPYEETNPYTYSEDFDFDTYNKQEMKSFDPEIVCRAYE
ncbi:ABC-type glycerol-3-phosphate transport system substrate-binding protein [Paenibacillus endophyticus]|uniref:ABC-type glycerol-3-phosphate transport system substrate-binding protein n=1 Tax=Paenibacillus endophyticus TaxID=1294268 RepID=A0A7W5CBC8_9BACL|nr:hypothetical protein [Paenibacillus endophyticus]MBB3154064.1 ABC-type glycerol-3-phosphate transport system substrate-binding protein [Paenibacillus endophyticus]